jgi:hypothetical protein
VAGGRAAAVSEAGRAMRVRQAALGGADHGGGRGDDEGEGDVTARPAADARVVVVVGAQSVAAAGSDGSPGSPSGALLAAAGAADAAGETSGAGTPGEARAAFGAVVMTLRHGSSVSAAST